MKIKFPRITVKLLKKMVLRALFLVLLLIPAGALGLLSMIGCVAAFVFIPIPYEETQVMQVTFAVVAFIFYARYTPDACHWADKYV